MIRCRHCGKIIHRIPSQPDESCWEDGDGFVVCIKRGSLDIGASYVFHRPLPAGLRGGLPATRKDQPDG